METLNRVLFGLLGYVLLTIPHFIGLFIYPEWLTWVCVFVGSIWVGPWLYIKYIGYQLKKNNPFRRK